MGLSGFSVKAHAAIVGLVVMIVLAGGSRQLPAASSAGFARLRAGYFVKAAMRSSIARAGSRRADVSPQVPALRSARVKVRNPVTVFARRPNRSGGERPLPLPSGVAPSATPLSIPACAESPHGALLCLHDHLRLAARAGLVSVPPPPAQASNHMEVA
jgi:hypothetical protein